MQAPNLYEGFEYYRPYHSKLLEIVETNVQKLCLVAGRRFGKSFTLAIKFVDRFLQRLYEANERIEQGIDAPWLGLDFTKAQDIRQFQSDVVKATIVTATTDQYQVIQTYIKTRLFSTGADIYLHPNADLHRIDRGKEIWFLFGQAGGVIKFRCASQTKQLVGDKTHLLWLDECGFIDNQAYEALKPLLWEFDGDLFASGTPELGEDHWFTKLAISGLPADHERANNEVRAPDPSIKTFLATALDAYLPEVRQQAQKELDSYGEDSTFAKQFILADWRMPGMFVYDNWQPSKHIVDFSLNRGVATLTINGEKKRLPKWNRVYGAIDWFEGVAPGGCIVAYYWIKNPLSQDDTRPLLVIADEHHGKDPYTRDGWFGHFDRMTHKHGVSYWYCDPADPALINQSQREGFNVVPASNKDKLGRIGLIKALLHHTDKLAPALYVSPRCKVTCNQFAKYQRKVRRFTGEILEEPRQYNDALLDALAYLAGEIGSSLRVAGGAVGD